MSCHMLHSTGGSHCRSPGSGMSVLGKDKNMHRCVVFCDALYSKKNQQDSILDFQQFNYSAMNSFKYASLCGNHMQYNSASILYDFHTVEISCIIL